MTVIVQVKVVTKTMRWRKAGGDAPFASAHAQILQVNQLHSSYIPLHASACHALDACMFVEHAMLRHRLKVSQSVAQGCQGGRAFRGQQQSAPQRVQVLHTAGQQRRQLRHLPSAHRVGEAGSAGADLLCQTCQCLQRACPSTNCVFWPIDASLPCGWSQGVVAA